MVFVLHPHTGQYKNPRSSTRTIASLSLGGTGRTRTCTPESTGERISNPPQYLLCLLFRVSCAGNGIDARFFGTQYAVGYVHSEPPAQLPHDISCWFKTLALSGGVLCFCARPIQTAFCLGRRIRNRKSQTRYLPRNEKRPWIAPWPLAQFLLYQYSTFKKKSLPVFFRFSNFFKFLSSHTGIS